ncbi:MAG: hypothetical protein AB1763_01275 [Campylobacterota bacterium]
MTLTFLHPEFFTWMLPPTLALFYFWQTQKPVAIRWLSAEVLEKLRPEPTTMGLKARNRLFLVAAAALIAAMAQPVAIEPQPAGESPLKIVVAVETGGDEAALERSKRLGSELIGRLAGAEIAVAAFDTRLYRVSPLTDDVALLRYLVGHLPRTGESSDADRVAQNIAQKMPGDAVILVSGSRGAENGRNILHVRDASDIVSVTEALESLAREQKLKNHIPLFFYPLGLAMFLIWIALSSMSPRRSVTVAAALTVLAGVPSPSVAGVLDFWVLHEAREAYEKGEYAKSAALFERYRLSHDTPQVRYNEANALYKAGRYREAQRWYERAVSGDPVLEARRRFNLSLTRIRTGLGEGGEKLPSADRIGKPERPKPASSQGMGAFTTPLYPLD